MPGSDGILNIKVITLFDTGASGNNFVSKKFIDNNNLHGYIDPMKKKVRVANGDTMVIDSSIVLKVSFKHGSSESIERLKFLVMQGLSLDLVIGLPDICRVFKGVLFDMMQDEESLDDFFNIDQTF